MISIEVLNRYKDINQYTTDAARTDLSDAQYAAVAARLNDPRILMLLHAYIGICTELGESMDALKKYLFYGKALDETNIMEEYGDSQWYHSLIPRALGAVPSLALAKNIEKLYARYPEKFTEVAALNRDLQKEREVLEAAPVEGESRCARCDRRFESPIHSDNYHPDFHPFKFAEAQGRQTGGSKLVVVEGVIRRMVPEPGAAPDWVPAKGDLCAECGYPLSDKRHGIMAQNAHPFKLQPPRSE